MGPRSFDRGNNQVSAACIDVHLASMGPRSFDRGNSNRKPVLRHKSLPLQWGRDLSTAETRDPMHPESFRDRASMGPRSFDRGNAVASTRIPRTLKASMGPRSFDRGNFSPWDGSHRGLELQWGRDLSTAETSDAARHVSINLQLQWGRDLSTAETPCPYADARFLKGFNGAAIFRPRKLATYGMVAVGGAVLQWGRDVADHYKT